MNKKKLRRILLGLMVVSLAVTCQIKAQTYYGIQGMIMHSNVWGNDASNSKARTLLGGGIYLGIPLTNDVLLEPQIFYEIKGVSDINNSSYPQYFIHRFKLPYLVSSLIIKWNIASEKFTPFLGAGPYLSILLKEVDLNWDYDNDFKMLDWGGVTEGGVQICQESLCSALFFRLEAGAHKIDDAGWRYFSKDVKNVSLAFGVKVSRK